MAKLISLTQNKDFRRIYHRGKTAVTPYFAVYYTVSRRKYCRLGMTVGKKLGKAVVRNRIKRIIRVAYSTVIESVDVSEHCYDFVIVARHRCITAKSGDVTKELFCALKTAGLIK